MKEGGGGCLVKDKLNHSENSSTSVKLIEKLFITGCCLTCWQSATYHRSVLITSDILDAMCSVALVIN